MSVETYDLVFSGELVRGADPVQARRNLGQLFKISEDKVDALFSGKPKTLKKNLDFATATKYRVAIKKAGCRVDLVEQKPEPSQASSAASQAQGKAVFAARELSQADTNASGKSEPEGSAESELKTEPELKAEPEPQAESEPQVAAEAKALPKAPVETPPLPQVEEISEYADYTEFAKKPAGPGYAERAVESSLSVAPASGNLVDTSELEHLAPIHVDTSGLSICEVGGYLLAEDEKEPFIERDIALSASVSELGSDLLDDSEQEPIEMVEIDLSDYSVAEPGADLGQLKSDEVTVVPNISHLKIES